MTRASAPARRGGRKTTGRGRPSAGTGRGRTAQKGSRLEGGAIGEEAIASSPDVLGVGAHGQASGLQQFFSPPEAAALCAAILAEAPCAALDITAGDGSLLAGWDPPLAFGIEVDAAAAKAGKGRYTPLVGDLQRLYPLLRARGTRFPRVLANPPWGLRWQVPGLHGGRAASSTLLGLKMALGLLAEDGEGVLITSLDRYRREVEPDGDGGAVWCTVAVPDLFDGVGVEAVIAFLAGPAARLDGAAPERLEASRDGLEAIAGSVRAAREGRVESGLPIGTPISYVGAFEAVAQEHARRLKADRRGRGAHDLGLRGARLRVSLSPFSQVALREREGYGTLRSVEAFNRKPLSYLALNRRDWRAVEGFAAEGILTVEPALAAAAQRALADLDRELCPLYEVRPQMRLGFLEELDRIRCRASDPERGFREGESYPIATRSQIGSSEEERPYEKRDGSFEVRRFLRRRKLLDIQIGEERFDEGAESIDYIRRHFEVPDPGHIGERFPEETARARAILDRFPERFGWAAKGIAWKDLEREGGEVEVWQREDLVRLIVKGDGAMLGWEQGGGKTLGLTALALGAIEYWGLARQALFVVPQDLIPQWQREARRFFDLEFEQIESVAAARAVRRAMHAGGEGFFITWYELLTISGARRETMPGVTVSHRRRDGEGREFTARLSSEEACPGCGADQYGGWSGEACRRCGYVHRTLEVRCAASQLSTAFRRGVVCVDELSLIRGRDSRRSKAVRALRGACRFGGSGTPISNFVNDCFWPLWWVLGNATARFPYDYDDGPAQFQADFCVLEYLMGREEDGEGHVKKRVKVLPEVTNVSVLWRLLSAGLVRRRQEQMGEMVPRREVAVEVPMGRTQLALHKGWLADFPRFFEARHPDHPLTQKPGAVKRFAAVLGQLAKLEYASTMPAADPDADWVLGGGGPLASAWTPAVMKVLELALKHVRGGEKVLIGSDLIEPGPFICARLRERGVRAIDIVKPGPDGAHQTKGPRQRAAEIAAFARGPAQVLCTGTKAMRLGHSLSAASVEIVLGFPWSHEEYDQFKKRVHRLDSPRPVTIYVIYPRFAMGWKKFLLLGRKAAASDLALDGQLIDIPEEAIDWRKAIAEMAKAGAELDGQEAIDEETLRELWEAAEGPYAPLRPRPDPVPREPLDPDSTEQLELFALAA